MAQSLSVWELGQKVVDRAEHGNDLAAKVGYCGTDWIKWLAADTESSAACLFLYGLRSTKLDFGNFAQHRSPFPGDGADGHGISSMSGANRDMEITKKSSIRENKLFFGPQKEPKSS